MHSNGFPIVLVLLLTFSIKHNSADTSLEEEDDVDLIGKRQIAGHQKSVQHAPNTSYFVPGLHIPFGIDDFLKRKTVVTTPEPTPEPELEPETSTFYFTTPVSKSKERTTPTEPPTSAIHKETVGQPWQIKKSTLYNDCGKTKSCFGFPDGCIQKKSCWLAMALWHDNKISRFSDEDYVNIALTATNPASRGYVSLGFSDDRYMGDDFVISCLHVPSGPQVFIQQSYNNDRYQNVKIVQNSLARIIVGYAQVNGVLTCFLKLDTTGIYSINGHTNRTYNFLTNNHHILMAFGRYNDKMEKFGNLLGHFAAAASKHEVRLQELIAHPKIISVYSSALIQWHAITSILVHAFLLPASIILAKYGQEAFSKIVSGPNMPLWNLVHSIMTILSCIFSILGGIFIAKEVGWRSHTKIAEMHSCFGIVVYVMYLLSCTSAIYLWIKRNDVQNYYIGKINIVRWFHWIIGNISVLIGMFMLLFAPEMKRAYVPCIFRHLAGLLLLVHLLTVVFMSFHTYWLSTILGSEIRLQVACVGPIVPFQPENDEILAKFHKLEAWSGRRRVVIFYFIATALICTGMIGIMCFPVTLCFWY